MKAGEVGRPDEYVFGGHREISKRSRKALVDIDETLLCFGTAKKEARRSYMSAIRAGMAEDVEEDRHSWHPFRAPGDEDLEVKTTRPMIDFFGRSTDKERPHLNADVFVALVCEILDVEKEHVCSRTRDRATARVRRLIATLGVERWRQNLSLIHI